jgi:hypothetical protein
MWLHLYPVSHKERGMQDEKKEYIPRNPTIEPYNLKFEFEAWLEFSTDLCFFNFVAFYVVSRWMLNFMQCRFSPLVHHPKITTLSPFKRTFNRWYFHPISCSSINLNDSRDRAKSSQHESSFPFALSIVFHTKEIQFLFSACDFPTPETVFPSSETLFPAILFRLVCIFLLVGTVFLFSLFSVIECDGRVWYWEPKTYRKSPAIYSVTQHKIKSETSTVHW